MIATDCPDRNRLHKFLAGQLDHETAAELEQHLEDCPQCEQTIQQLETEPDTVVEVLRTWNASSAEDSIAQAPEFLAAQKFAASLAERLRPAGSLKLANCPVIGAYELVDILGQGGMGTVYLARHRQLDKQVAIKLLPAISARQQAVVTRFQREIRAAGKLDHPAIVRATDAGEVDGVHFLVMDVIDGLDVGQVCRRVGPLSVADACEITRQAAVGLTYAHSQGVVHRDVKPSNLMLNRCGQVKILDFGLAQMSVWTDEATQLTTVGQLMGTLDYMAPEQAEGSQAPSERADIYALGATLFRLLTGRPPLAASSTASPLEKLRLIASQEPPAIDSLRSDLPPKLSQLIMQMLARDPGQRPQTAQEVAQRLSAFCEAADLVRLISVAEEAAQELTNFASETDPPSPLQPRPSAGKPPGSAWKWVALASFGALLVFGALFALETSKGQLIIDSKDADLHVKLLKDGQAYRELEIHPGVTVTKLYSGNYEIVLDQASDGVAISQQRFEIKLGDKVVATIRQQPGEAVAANEPQPAGKPTAEAVKVAAVVSKTATVRSLYLGRLQKRDSGSFSAVRDGVVKNLNVHLGQEVKKGDLIAEVVSADNEKQTLEARFDSFVIGLKVAEGDKVKKGDMLMLLSASGPAIVNFDVSEDDRQEFVQRVLNGDVKMEMVFDENEKKYDQPGKLTKVDGQVDSHGNVELQAEFPNPEGKVGTGTRAWIEINPTLENVTLIPKEAVYRRGYRTSVYVVDDNQVAHLRDVTVMNSWEDYYVVKSGVIPGEMVVVAGLSQVQDGENVTATILEKPTANTGDEAEKPAAKPVKVATVEAKTVTVTYRYLGHLQKRALGFLSPDRDGIVKNLNVHLGQEVKKGDLIAEVVSADNEKETIEAPFDAFVIGLKVTKGDKVNAGDMLAFLSASGPAVVDFDVSEANRLEFIQWVVNDDVKMELLFENNDKKYDQPGKLSKIDGKVDSHGNIELQAEFPNPEGKVGTGTLVYIEINPTLKNATIIPKQAVFRQDHRSCVFVVDDNQVAHLRDIKVNNVWEDYYVITSGVSPGESIVVEGASNVQAGQKVVATNPQEPNAKAETPVVKNVRVASVERQPVTIQHQYGAKLVDRNVYPVKPAMDGVLGKRQVDSGQRVKKDDVLFEMTPSTAAEGESIEVKSPADGMVSSIFYHSGSFAKRGESVMYVVQEGPITAEFNVPERAALEYLNLRSIRELKVELVSADGHRFDQLGVLSKIGREVNSQTGNVPFEATFDNLQGAIKINQTGTILVRRSIANATVVPQQATFEILGKRYLFVVDENHIAHQREIFVEAETEDQFVIQSGVNAGEQIVIDGVRQVHDGEEIK